MKKYGCTCDIRYFGKPHRNVEILYSHADELYEKYNNLLEGYPEEDGYDVSIVRIKNYDVKYTKYIESE